MEHDRDLAFHPEPAPHDIRFLCVWRAMGAAQDKSRGEAK
jgi:hypothetical protein